ncbi:PP2C family protein-serine/threonine phosphatase [Reichenbachiella versicolor]|uniref:PP2C family protein-serine/threonine phosphatase n=1 Tax=Reichenbachiella versicolor TaxID=1821036 RepID=UPI0013A53E79|nr:SpoIIE family protein phosphatase [Reichenbachiella versicolor]
MEDLSVKNYHSSFPSEEYLNRLFGQTYVINWPMSEVGGDGYWAYEDEEGFAFLIVYDCSGHGRFASMMTRYYANILTEAIKGQGLKMPSSILDFVHESAKNDWVNHQNNLNVGKSADMGVMVLDKSRKKIYFSGAGMDFVYIQKEEFNKIEGSKVQVGDRFDIEHSYSYAEIPLRKLKKTSCYMFSDGATDIFGGPRNKKLKLSGLIEAIVKCQKETTLKEEKAQMEKFFNHWSGSNEPLDDLLLIGLRF